MKRHRVETIEQAVAMYMAGTPHSVISETLGVSIIQARRWAMQRGIPRRNPGVTETAKQRILELYKRGLGGVKISQETGVDETGVYRTIRQARIMRTKQEVADRISDASRLRILPITSSRAWALGVIFGNGGIAAGRKGTLTISADNRDADVLQKIVAILDVKPAIYQRNGCKSLHVYGKRFIEQLRNEFGLSENKCLEMRWPSLPFELYRHFVRGLLDSDGSWHCRNGRQSDQLIFTYASIAGPFVHSLEECLYQHVDVCPRKVRRRDRIKPFRPGGSQPHPIYHLEYSHFDCLEIGSWLYRGQTDRIRGERKYKIWREYSDAFIEPHWILRHQRHRAKLRALAAASLS